MEVCKNNLSQESRIKNNDTTRLGSLSVGWCLLLLLTFWLLIALSALIDDITARCLEVHSLKGGNSIFFFFFFKALMIYIIGLSVCGVWFWCCLITAGLHVHPSARGTSITPPLSHSSNSQNDVIIPFFFSLPLWHLTWHKNIHARSRRYFLWLSSPAKGDWRPLGDKRGAFCAFDMISPPHSGRGPTKPGGEWGSAAALAPGSLPSSLLMNVIFLH